MQMRRNNLRHGVTNQPVGSCDGTKHKLFKGIPRKMNEPQQQQQWSEFVVRKNLSSKRMGSVENDERSSWTDKIGLLVPLKIRSIQAGPDVFHNV